MTALAGLQADVRRRFHVGPGRRRGGLQGEASALSLGLSNDASSDSNLRKPWTPLATPRDRDASIAAWPENYGAAQHDPASGGGDGHALAQICSGRTAGRRRVSIATRTAGRLRRRPPRSLPRCSSGTRVHVESDDLARELRQEVTQVPSSVPAHVAEVQRRFHDAAMEWLQGALLPQLKKNTL